MSSQPACRLLMPVLASASLLAAGSSSPRAITASPAMGSQAAASRPWVTLPKAAEHRYRIKAKIRLLLFWVGRDNVGSARMAWYRGDGEDRGYEVLIGSDPERAPRKINRWGYISEEHRGTTATTFGVMKPSDETSLEEAQAHVENQDAGAVFSMIREMVTGGESVAQVTTTRVSRDYSYRELDGLVTEFTSTTAAPVVRRMHVNPDVTPGLLSTITKAIHDDAEARRRARAPRGAKGKVWRYAYNARTYTLTLASSEAIGSQQHGGRTFANLIQNEFEITMSGFSWMEKFTIVYAMEGPEAELPVFVVYQPRWWLKAELHLDDSQTF